MNDFAVVQRSVHERFVDRWKDLLVVMLGGSPLAAVKPVANELDVALRNDKCPKAVEKLAAVKPVTSVPYPLEEHVKHCRGYERLTSIVVQHVHGFTNMLERSGHERRYLWAIFRRSVRDPGVLRTPSNLDL